MEGQNGWINKGMEFFNSYVIELAKQEEPAKSQSIGAELLPLLMMEISCDMLAPLGGGYLRTGVVVN